MGFQTVKGMRDLMPEEMIKRNRVLAIVKKVFERWGYAPLETPALESFDLLAKKGGGGEAIKKEIYYFKDQGERELGMRFDLTVPLARIIAGNPSMAKPFKRYQIEKVWRYDNPQAGRYREFLQTDVDVIGSNEMNADAEVISVACEVLNELGFKKFIVKLNNRKIIEDFILSFGVKDIYEVFRSIDKLDKFGKDVVSSELKTKGLNDEQIKKILKMVETSGSLKDVKGKMKFDGMKLAEEGMDELVKIMEIVKSYGYSKNIEIDLSLVRGLDYYTGPVFEIVLEDERLSVAGGGRYNNMIQSLGGLSTPAVGISLGFDRIVELMKKKNMFDERKSLVDVYVVSVNEDVKKDVLDICKMLRDFGFNCDSDLMGRKVGRQIEYANTLGVKAVVIVGPDELKKKSVKIKDMLKGKEKIVKIKDIQSQLLDVVL